MNRRPNYWYVHRDWQHPGHYCVVMPHPVRKKAKGYDGLKVIAERLSKQDAKTLTQHHNRALDRMRADVTGRFMR